MNGKNKFRPIGIIILTAFILFYSAWNGLRLGEVFFFWKTLAKYGNHPFYIALSGGIWLTSGLVIAWGLWMSRTWCKLAAATGAITYTIWYWLDRLLLQEPHANWPFSLIVNIIILILIFLTLFSSKLSLLFMKNPYER